MSIHRAFWMALAAFWLPMAAPAVEPGRAVHAESGETVPNPAGRGFTVGNTGLTLGGYLAADAEDLEGDDYYSEAEGHLFVFYEPVRFLRLFTDLEVLIDEIALERGYVDLGFNDPLNLRLGKFLTPIGRWNQAHIEPLTWTTSEPVLIENVFDDTVSGASLHGSLFPRGGALSYALYASLVDPIAVDADEGFAEDSAGARVEWASLDGWTAGLSYYASRPAGSRWHHLGGVDLLWQPHRRVEVSAEALAGEGSRTAGAVYGAYAQAAVEIGSGFYGVVRVEGLSLPADLPTARFAVAGLVWAPLPSVRFKADYMFANEAGRFGEPGARMSLSYLF
ncbi:MAG: hypothetical protein ACRETF_10440 [Nevskiaceae bacterium]